MRKTDYYSQKIKPESDTKGDKCTNWHTTLLNCTKVGSSGMKAGRANQCMIVLGQKVYLQ